MDVKSFLISFENTLIETGFSKETAREHTLKIAKSLKETDVKKIHSMQDNGVVKAMAKNYSSKVINTVSADNRNNIMADTVSIHKQFNEAANFSDVNEENQSGAKRKKTAVITDDIRSYDNVKQTNINDGVKTNLSQTKTAATKTQRIDRVSVKQPKVPLTEDGKKAYRKWMMTKGIGTGALVFISALGIALTYILIAIFIAVLVALLVAVAALGCVGTLAGLIYGIVKLFSVVPEGIYEIGLALVMLAVTLASSILLYNLSVRIVPKLWKRFTQFIKYKKTDLRAKLNKIRTECNGQ